MKRLALPITLCGTSLDMPQLVALPQGQAVAFTCTYPGRLNGNEDAVGVFTRDPASVVLAVADGVGGMPHGAAAAKDVIEALAAAPGDTTGLGVAECIHQANDAILARGLGAASTVSVLEINNGTLTSHHAGDSAALVVGQRGRTKLRSNCHSPVGISESSGLLSEQQALLHPRRNLLSNMVGDVNLWVESMPPLALATRDTALVASDGLWDNLYIAEIIDAIRRGTLLQAAGKLAELALRRMSEPRPGVPSKPDDLSFILYRPS